MCKWSAILIFYLLSIHEINSQNPHGKDLNIDCILCHSSENWSFNKTHATFNHNNTEFTLTGQHKDLECRSCHTSLIFKDADNYCVSCHTDIHQFTVGADCARCHNSSTWVVQNIIQIHEQTSFPLMGAHATVNCNACHVSETNLRFGPIHPECISCHEQDYQLAKQPDHNALRFSTDCAICHKQTSMDWMGVGIVHSFFPLEQGHQISDCSQCHKTNNYKEISPECINCHLTDFKNAKNPDHTAFPTQCNLCHTLAIGWMPASFSNHDSKFPIYSGKHKGEWDQCIECHTVAGNYSSFSCIDCHEHNNAGRLAKEHDEVRGYQFVSSSCYSCHPKGN